MFDPLVTTATELRQRLEDGKITSVQIVQEYLAQIDRYNSKLNAFISIAPRDKVIRAAAALDQERRCGIIKSPLHGIPIVLKDCFVTASSLGMSTTAGAWAFKSAKATTNGHIVQKLIDAGLIILGKTNMTELCGMKLWTTPGRSAIIGQTLSPYVGHLKEDEGILGHSSPGGSSTGSAVAVAAGFSPLALGTETIGSIVTPAGRNALYALKPTVGTQNSKGMYRMTDFYDSPGPIAKSSADLALLAVILLDQPYDLATMHSENLSVGFLSSSVWFLGPEMCRQYGGTAEQMARDYEETVSILASHGCKVKYPVEFPSADELTVDGKSPVMSIAFWEFKNIGLPGFIQSFETCDVNNLEDLVNFNETNKHQALPNDTDQELLVKSLACTESQEDINHLTKVLREKARKIVDGVLERSNIDLLAAPTDSAFATYAAAAGYPLAAVPLGQLRHNKRPFGLCVMAKANQEGKLLRFQAVYENAVAARPIPEFG
ncbi:amidase signature domain-containing protein [Pestalotiopsis sp. NC0098]|nr:amidase signature domain-containing protein [Pestalotiopsis sp. NC0098]